MVVNLQGQLDADRPFTLLAWGHWFAFANMVLALVISYFYIEVNPAPETLLGCIFMLITWIGHFAFLSLSCFILTIFPVITLFPNKRHIRGVSAIMATLFQVYLFLDLLAYRGLGYHLTTSSIEQLREVEDVYVASLGTGYWFLLLAVFLAILAYQFFASNVTWKRIHQLQAFRFKNQLASTLFACFMLSHFMHIWADATLNADIARQGALFPGSYPLTAKTLLARHGLIDLAEYEEDKSKRTSLSQLAVKTRTFDNQGCDVSLAPKLDVYFYPREELEAVKAWLTSNNIAYQHSKQLNLSKDLDTNLFNFSTGLPGLYQYTDAPNLAQVNEQLGVEKIALEVMSQGLDTTQKFVNPSHKRLFVFYRTDTDTLFYRTDVLLVGFTAIQDMAINPQNLIAAYIQDALSCPEYVEQILVDKSYSALSPDDVLSNFTQGYFHLIYKDKTMLFKNGSLVTNKTFSSGHALDEPIPLHIVQKAIDQLSKTK